MLNLPKVTEQELEIFKNKKILIYSVEGNPVMLYQILKNLGYDVIGIYAENLTFLLYCKNVVRGYKVLNSNEITSLIKEQKNLIIQDGSGGVKEVVSKIKEKVIVFGVEYSEIPAGKLIYSFGDEVAIKWLRNPFQYLWKTLRWQYCIQISSYSKELKRISRNDLKLTTVMCSPPKTADFTLDYTIKSLEANINYLNISHKPRCLKQYRGNKLKIIMGVRDPISQNLSLYYHELGSALPIEKHILGTIYNKKEANKREIITEYEILFKEEGENIQVLWEKYIERFFYPTRGEKLPPNPLPMGIQEFICEFQENVFDILQHSFDKEKGCGILREGKIEVFVYQLEKLNSVIPELSDFVGVPFTALVDANKAEDKWIGESYKQACKEIEITQDYFDRCYNEPYVKHFYSDADIEKFKERWRSHIV